MVSVLSGWATSALHQSHRASLLRKDPECYADCFPDALDEVHPGAEGLGLPGGHGTSPRRPRSRGRPLSVTVGRRDARTTGKPSPLRSAGCS